MSNIAQYELICGDDGQWYTANSTTGIGPFPSPVYYTPYAFTGELVCAVSCSSTNPGGCPTLDGDFCSRLNDPTYTKNYTNSLTTLPPEPGPVRPICGTGCGSVYVTPPTAGSPPSEVEKRAVAATTGMPPSGPAAPPQGSFGLCTYTDPETGCMRAKVSCGEEGHEGWTVMITGQRGDYGWQEVKRVFMKG